MNAKQMAEFEQKRAAKKAAEKLRRERQAEFPDSVKSAGLVIGMTPEAKHEWFNKLREAAK